MRKNSWKFVYILAKQCRSHSNLTNFFDKKFQNSNFAQIWDFHLKLVGTPCILKNHFIVWILFPLQMCIHMLFQPILWSWWFRTLWTLEPDLLMFNVIMSDQWKLIFKAQCTILTGVSFNAFMDRQLMFLIILQIGEGFGTLVTKKSHFFMKTSNMSL